MTIDQFRSTLADDAPPEALTPALKAMWQVAKGNWEAAHSIAQTIEDDTGSLIHAHLHREEGDLGNAGYWYRLASQPIADDSLAAEWTRIVSRILGAGPAGLDNK